MLAIEKLVKIIIVMVVLVLVIVSFVILWNNYIKPYLSDLGKEETAGLKTSIFLPILALARGNSKKPLIKKGFWVIENTSL
jgi:hypothetical protein